MNNSWCSLGELSFSFGEYCLLGSMGTRVRLESIGCDSESLERLTQGSSRSEPEQNTVFRPGCRRFSLHLRAIPPESAAVKRYLTLVITKGTRNCIKL